MELKISVFQWVFQTIPECLALVSLALTLAGRKLDLKNVLRIGIVQAVIVYGVRLLPITFGIHTIIFIVSLAALLHFIIKEKLGRSLFFSLVVFIALIIMESAINILILAITELSFEYVFSNWLMRTLFGLPHVIAIFLLALAVRRWQGSLSLLPEKLGGKMR